MITRREAIKRGALLGLAAAALPYAPAVAQKVPSNRHFVVLRDGNTIGHHAISFGQAGEDLTVDIDIELKVKLAFVTLYSLVHHNREVWRGGRLHTIKTNTVENGKKYDVLGEDQGEAFKLAVRAGDKAADRVLPRTIVPTSYWNPATQTQTSLLNSVNGEILEVKVLARGAEAVKIPKGPVEASKYSITGGLNLDLWYDGGNEVVRLAFENRGSLIEYELRG